MTVLSLIKKKSTPEVMQYPFSEKNITRWRIEMRIEQIIQELIKKRRNKK